MVLVYYGANDCLPCTLKMQNPFPSILQSKTHNLICLMDTLKNTVNKAIGFLTYNEISQLEGLAVLCSNQISL